MSVQDNWELHGYVMTCRNDCIADDEGHIPLPLQQAMDGKYFQAELNRCAAMIMGRRAHQAIPNPKQRVRAIVSRNASALDHKEGGWWWNPAVMSMENMLRIVAPSGGKVAVIGGRETIAYFLQNGLQVLHVCRAESHAIKDGLKLFDACDGKTTADMVLRDKGMRLSERKLIDLKAPVSLSTWRSD